MSATIQGSISAHNIVVEVHQAKARIPVLWAPSFEAQAGAITGIVGPSGCGKTTLLNVLSLLTRPNQGQVMIGGAIAPTGEKARLGFWRESASFIFQDYGIIEEWSVAENITLTRNPWKSQRSSEELRELIARIGLAGRENTTAALLSGGEKQRVGIARAIYKHSAFIFADEPTASLDAANRELVIELLRHAANRGSTVIVATHDNDMMNACDSLCVLQSPLQSPGATQKASA